MTLFRWFTRRTALASSHEVADELRRARRYNEKVANHRPMRTTDAAIEWRNGTVPTP